MEQVQARSGGGFVMFDKYQDRSGEAFVTLNRYQDRSGVCYVDRGQGLLQRSDLLRYGDVTGACLVAKNMCFAA